MGREQAAGWAAEGPGFDSRQGGERFFSSPKPTVRFWTSPRLVADGDYSRPLPSSPELKNEWR